MGITIQGGRYMTNAQIILQNSVFLMEQGVLKPTDEKILFADEEGNVREVNRPEEIHTFNEWKKLGCMVEKGQHAVAKFPIWKKAKGKRNQEEEPDEKQEDPAKTGGRFFMKMAFFFTADQVKEVTK
jgi:hypothetical protein